jgi:outer membrane protein assembly factor BamB
MPIKLAPAVRLAAVAGMALVLTPGVGAQSGKTAPEASALPASRVLVQLWKKPGAFERLIIASTGSDCLYLGGTPRGLDAVEPDSGLTRWRHIGKLPVDSAPTERDRTVLLVEGGQLVTLDRQTGLELTRSKTRIGLRSPIYAGESAWVVAGSDDHLYALVPDTSLKSWRTLIGDYIVSSTWNGANMAYFISAKGMLYAVSIPTREIAWRYDFKKVDVSPPVFWKKYVLVGSVDSYVYVLDSSGGAVVAKILAGNPVLQAPVPARDRLYFTSNDGVLHAVDLGSQTELWTASPGGRVLTTTPEHVLCVRRDRTSGVNLVDVLDAATGKAITEASSLKYERFVAAPESGVFFAVGDKGDVLAIADRSILQGYPAAKQKDPARATAPPAVTAPPAPPAATVPPPPAATK